MSVPAPNLQHMTIPQLLQALSAGHAGSPMHQQATFMLQFRIAEKQAEVAAQQAQAAAQQAAAAEGMIQPTRDLAKFTQGLARATWALFFVGGATVLLTIVQVLKAIGWTK